MQETVRRKTVNGERFLSFTLANETYCVEIERVREIMVMTAVTPLPQTPDFIKGVINLRGKIIPIIDLRLKFGMDEKDYTDRTCIIVVDVTEGGESALMGIVVDTILEVVTIPTEKITHMAYVSARVRAEYLRGVAESEQGVRIVLDIARVLSAQEFKTMREAGGAAAEQHAAQAAYAESGRV
jgi:purine-binding chemotaxis protein CheW